MHFDRECSVCSRMCTSVRLFMTIELEVLRVHNFLLKIGLQRLFLAFLAGKFMSQPRI